MFNLSGKTALVTGCKRGIGYAMAEGLAEAGADIIGVSATLEKSGSKIAEAVAAAGKNFTGYTCDFSNRESLYSFIEEVKANHDDLWDQVIDVNLNSQFILSREFGAGMVERGSGKIIFTASLLTFQGGITVPGYAASKGAIGQLTKALSNEWAGKGVNVNSIAPGYIATDNTQALQDDPVRAEQILGRIPAGRWGAPSDFKGPCVFLASKSSDYVNGEVLVVDGGWMGR